MITPEEQFKNLLQLVIHEGQELFRFYNFFFAAMTAIAGFVLLGRIEPEKDIFVYLAALLLTVIWLAVIERQKKWRESWVDSMRQMEEDPSLFEKNDTPRLWVNREVGGTWKLALVLPLGFYVTWLYFIVQWLLNAW